MRSSAPRRVLMTADAVGGVWSYALTLAQGLGRRAEILLAVMGPAPSESQRQAAAVIANLHLVHGDFRLEWMAASERDLARAATWLRDLAARFAPEIVHVNGYAAAAQPWSVPVVLVAHSCVLSWWRAVHGTAAPDEWRPYAARVREALSRADQVVAPTQAMLRALAEHYGMPRPGRVIANGSDLGRFAAATKERFVLAAGRLWDEGKNLKAVDAAAAQSPWPFYVAGDCRSPDGRTLEPQHACALGRLPEATLAQWMARAALYAAPARYEPFGLSVLEAAASGCALVLGDIPSLRELWADAALFVAPDDAAGLATAVDVLMRNDERRRLLGIAARARASRFSAARMAEEYDRLYGALAERRRLARVG